MPHDLIVRGPARGTVRGTVQATLRRPVEGTSQRGRSRGAEWPSRGPSRNRRQIDRHRGPVEGPSKCPKEPSKGPSKGPSERASEPRNCEPPRRPAEAAPGQPLSGRGGRRLGLPFAAKYRERFRLPRGCWIFAFPRRFLTTRLAHSKTAARRRNSPESTKHWPWRRSWAARSGFGSCVEGSRRSVSVAPLGTADSNFGAVGGVFPIS
ncbi:hypothetical protein M885DRAFT_30824 [Pelagophyceae sp. CCMP2097]|nr:hypothetical protein M885DRAFT_30824 [Pelagophyceae sp. CCMP2097]